MKISIVIPAYNEEARLAETIQAAQAQTYQAFEVIVVNNASTDRTEAIARSFEGVIVVNEPRKGLPQAREAGRLAATGELIANMDADCLPEPDWLSRGAAFFANPGVSAVTGPYDYFDGGWWFRYGSFYTQVTLYWLIARLVQIPGIHAGAVMIGGNNLIRADALERVGGYNTALTFYGEDTDTAKRMAGQGRVVFSDRLVMKTSARRFLAEGFLALEWKYLRYFFKILLNRGNT